jgi:hypothetical protein
LNNAKAGAKLHGTKPIMRLIREGMPVEVEENKDLTEQLKHAMQAKLDNCKGQHARHGNNSTCLWYINMDNEEKSAELLAKLLAARWSSQLSHSSIARVIKAHMQVPEKVTGVEVTLTRKFGLAGRHHELVKMTFEFDGSNAARITCPTGCYEGRGLPGAVEVALQIIK